MRNIIFDQHFIFFSLISDQISALSKSYYSHFCQLRCISSDLDHKTASVIATSTVHSELYYC